MKKIMTKGKNSSIIADTMKEDLFWHRADNLIAAMERAVSSEWKKMWKNKILELMKNPDNRSYQLNELNKYGMNLIPKNRTLH